MEKKRLRPLFIALAISLVSTLGMAQNQLSTVGSDYWKRSETPLLGELIPVNQINLQKGVHLFDIETLGKSWEGMTNPFDTMGLGSFSTSNQETLLRLRYAAALSRYTYFGATAGFANRWEAELYDESGLADPEFFIGHHIPWRNGNFRMALTFSPSLGPASLEREVSLEKESAKGNFYRGGWSVRPEVAMTVRTGKVLIGAEMSYLYFGERTLNEKLNVSPEALNDPITMNGLYQHYLGAFGSAQDLNNGALYSNAGLMQGSDGFQTKISGGHTWAVKGLIEIPDWQRLGAEFIYGQVGSSLRENSFGRQVENEGGSFQEVRVYGRYKANDQMSITPLVIWMPSMPALRGQERLDSTNNVWGVQLTFRSKFKF
ncbi:MAG: hypothetical protein RJB66_2751 [Pseudomonadota bacterium]|jgi:hypothetical protein